LDEDGEEARRARSREMGAASVRVLSPLIQVPTRETNKMRVDDRFRIMVDVVVRGGICVWVWETDRKRGREGEWMRVNTQSQREMDVCVVGWGCGNK